MLRLSHIVMTLQACLIDQAVAESVAADTTCFLRVARPLRDSSVRITPSR